MTSYGNAATLMLKQELREHNVPATAIAELLGLHPNTVRNRLNDKGVFTVREIARIYVHLMPDMAEAILYREWVDGCGMAAATTTPLATPNPTNKNERNVEKRSSHE